jgi:hypothetical protein
VLERGLSAQSTDVEIVCFGSRVHPQFVGQHPPALFVGADGFSSIARLEMQAHKSSVSGFAEGLEFDHLPRQFNCGGRDVAAGPDLRAGLESSHVEGAHVEADGLNPCTALAGQEGTGRDLQRRLHRFGWNLFVRLQTSLHRVHGLLGDVEIDLRPGGKLEFVCPSEGLDECRGAVVYGFEQAA